MSRGMRRWHRPSRSVRSLVHHGHTRSNLLEGRSSPHRPHTSKKRQEMHHGEPRVRVARSTARQCTGHSNSPSTRFWGRRRSRPVCTNEVEELRVAPQQHQQPPAQLIGWGTCVRQHAPAAAGSVSAHVTVAVAVETIANMRSGHNNADRPAAAMSQQSKPSTGICSTHPTATLVRAVAS
jgi:hypothetical protein